MEHGFYKVYLESNGFKTPFVTYALSRADAAAKALQQSEDLISATVADVSGPFSSMMSLEAC
jgi:hypothetical protein